MNTPAAPSRKPHWPFALTAALALAAAFLTPEAHAATSAGRDVTDVSQSYKLRPDAL